MGYMHEKSANEAEHSQRSKIRKRLEALSKSEPPSDLAMGAMCYDLAPGPDRVEYVCPTCGQKVLYATPEVRNDKAQPIHGSVRRFLAFELPSCRRAVKGVKGLKVELDESEFCPKCTAALRYPRLALLVHYEGEKTPHRVEGVSVDDVQLVREFLQGKKKHREFNDAETSMQDHTERLSELLGVEMDTE